MILLRQKLFLMSDISWYNLHVLLYILRDKVVCETLSHQNYLALTYIIVYIFVSF